MLYIKYVRYQNILYTKYTLYQILTSFPCVLSLGPSSTVLQHWKVPGYYQIHIVHFKWPWNASKTCQKCFAQSAKTHWRKAQEGGWSLQPINAHTPGWRLLHRLLFCLARLAWWAFLHLTGSASSSYFKQPWNATKKDFLNWLMCKRHCCANCTHMEAALLALLLPRVLPHGEEGEHLSQVPQPTCLLTFQVRRGPCLQNLLAGVLARFSLVVH